MKIVFDAHIPFLKEAVQNEWPEVEICSMEPEQITSSVIRDADVLVVRTRTKVDAHLLTGSSVKMVCTATIGYDHIDTAFCKSHHIRWTACPGCNAQAVCNYIEQVLEELQAFHNPSHDTIGIVGVGQVGSLVARMAERRGLKVLLNDPPKGIGVSLDDIANNCDIITFHVPLDKTTYRMCDEAFLAKCKPNALIINAARGAIVEEQALLNSGHPYVLDTWTNEPHIDPTVLEHAQLASMHIAGYSVQGKRNASQMCLNSIAEQFGLNPIDISSYHYHGKATKTNSNEPWLAAISSQLKADPTAFESLRKAYPLREE